MTYKWARDFTLELLHQYSVAGEEIAASYNNQADYLRRIPKLLNAAAVTAAARAPLVAVAAVSGLERGRLGRWTTYRLPGDCMRVRCVLLPAEERLVRFHRFRLVGADLLAVWEELGPEAALEYNRRPLLLEEEPGEDAELDGTQEAQLALPYYAAAQIVMQDDSYAYAALLNEFESRLDRLHPGPRGEWEGVEDVYGDLY